MNRKAIAVAATGMCMLLGTACLAACAENEKGKDDYTKIEITSVSDLYAMEKGNYYVLTRDLDLQGNQWNPLSVDGFDGQGHTVSNFTVTSAGEQAYSGNGKYYSYSFLMECRWFENLTLSNVNITASQSRDDLYIAVGAARSEYVSGITVENVTIVQSVSAHYVGGVVGVVQSSGEKYTVKNCRVTDCSITAGAASTYTGGIAACLSRVNVENCYAEGIVKTGNDAGEIGGIAGHSWVVDITGCMAENNELIGDYVGGITGQLDGVYSPQSNIKGCVAEGNRFTGNAVGGLVGKTLAESNVYDCMSRENVICAGASVRQLAGLVAVNGGGCVVRSCLAVGNEYVADYGKTLGIHSTVASNSGTVRYVSSLANNFEAADLRNVSGDGEVNLTESDLKTPSVVTDELKLNGSIWTLTEGELPQIILNFNSEEK